MPVAEGSIEVYSIKPKIAASRKHYVFEAYADDKETKLLVSLERPMYGEIIDIKLADIDNDQKAEFVVVMADTSTGQVVVKYDIIELSGRNSRSSIGQNRTDAIGSFRQVVNWAVGTD